MPTYTIVQGDTLPRIAEKLGHSGEWQALAAANLALVPPEAGDMTDEAKAATIAERMTPGVELAIPLDWVNREAPADESGVVPASSMTAAELIGLAGSAQTLAELDAIEAAANGRVTVLDAVEARRGELLDAGATA